MTGRAYLLHEWKRKTKLWYPGTQVYRVDPFATVMNGGKICATPHVIVAYTPVSKNWVKYPEIGEADDDYYDPMWGLPTESGFWADGPPETTIFGAHHIRAKAMSGDTFLGIGLDEGIELLWERDRIVGRHDPAAALAKLECGYEIIPGLPPKDLPFFDPKEFVYFY